MQGITLKQCTLQLIEAPRLFSSRAPLFPPKQSEHEAFQVQTNNCILRKKLKNMPAKSDFNTRSKIYEKTLLVLCAISLMEITKLMKKVAFEQSIIEAKEAPQIFVPERVCLCSLI